MHLHFDISNCRCCWQYIFPNRLGIARGKDFDLKIVMFYIHTNLIK